MGFFDFWGYFSKMFIFCFFFFKLDVEDLRIFIGIFMKSGLGVFGFLGGDGF